MYASCDCKNIEIDWLDTGQVLIPRACQCDYCKTIEAHYVSTADTKIRVTIHDEDRVKIVQHGTETADFFECIICEKLVFASSVIDGVIYGVINSGCLQNKKLLKEPQAFSYEGESLEQRLKRRQKNWCSPVVIEKAS
jgi:hypothetical protein